MASHNELGNLGEKIAANFLEEKGYSILEKNWRYGRQEVDLIARDKNFIVIVEVKTRSTNIFGEPEESVDLVKQRYLINAADGYMQQLAFEAEVRFDIISIIKSGTKHKIKHIEDAFIPLAE